MCETSRFEGWGYSRRLMIVEAKQLAARRFITCQCGIKARNQAGYTCRCGHTIKEVR
jgi:hypothetical protein